jgi:cell division protein FtsB
MRQVQAKRRGNATKGNARRMRLILILMLVALNANLLFLAAPILGKKMAEEQIAKNEREIEQRIAKMLSE